MKLFHLADLHIGKIVNGFSMIDEQKSMLNKVKEYIKKYKPDALILAGDIYDRSVPSFKAVSLFNDFLNDVLLNLKTPILAIAGNHDGAELIEFGSEIFAKSNLYIEGNINKKIRKVTFNDEFKNINFYLVPFADFAVVREVFGDKDIKSLDDAMQRIIDEIMIDFNENERNILITHAYVIGDTDPQVCDSEKKLIIGGKEYVRAQLFEKFDYVALGHLHRAQRVKSDKIRYSGSLLAYSFSEENYKKSITMVDINEDGKINIELLEMKMDKNMRTLKGSLDEIMASVNDTNKYDYIRAIITDDGELIEPMAKLKSVFPNVMLLEIQRNIAMNSSLTASVNDKKNKTTTELFEEFYKFHIDENISDEAIKIINDIENELRGEI